MHQIAQLNYGKDGGRKRWIRSRIFAGRGDRRRRKGKDATALYASATFKIKPYPLHGSKLLRLIHISGQVLDETPSTNKALPVIVVRRIVRLSYAFKRLISTIHNHIASNKAPLQTSRRGNNSRSNKNNTF